MKTIDILKKEARGEMHGRFARTKEVDAVWLDRLIDHIHAATVEECASVLDDFRLPKPLTEEQKMWNNEMEEIKEAIQAVITEPV